MSNQAYKNYLVELHPCGDCGVLPGYEHAAGCDVARCPLCGEQRISCGEHNSKRPSIWTGIWPGEVECAEFSMWVKWVDDQGTRVPLGDFSKRGHWVETTAEDPDKRPNLSLLYTGQFEWSRRLQRFVRRKVM